MKKPKILLLLLGFLLFYGNVQAQDLIERTRNGTQARSIEKAQYKQSYLESQSLKHRGPYTKIFPFTLQEDARIIARNAEHLSDVINLVQSEEKVDYLLNSHAMEAFSMMLPVTERKFVQLDLVEVFPLPSTFEINMSDGTTYTLEDFPARFFRGAVSDDPGSMAFITITKEGIQGVISDQVSDYNISPSKEAPISNCLFYNDQRLDLPETFHCTADEMEVPPYLPEELKYVGDNDRVASDCVMIYIEMEEDMYDNWNNVNTATSYLYQLMNAASGVYSNENINISFSDLKIWNTVDPYTETNIGALLNEFRDELRNNYDGRLAHLLTDRFGGSGIAKVDELCGNWTIISPNGPYAITSVNSYSIIDYPTYSRSVKVFTHELGHNFGSRHTHSCVWNGNSTQIDDYGNRYPSGGTDPDASSCYDSGSPLISVTPTIMSYYDSNNWGTFPLSNGFGTQPGNLIRSRVNSASCTLDCSGSTASCPKDIYHTGNIGSDTYYADRLIQSEGTVLNGRTVHYRSDIQSVLIPGFRVNAGGVFSAQHQACTAMLKPHEDHSKSEINQETTILKSQNK